MSYCNNEFKSIMLIEKSMSERDRNDTQLSFPVSESRDHIQGHVTAAVTLVEYGDYECPYCAQAYLIVKEVQERLGNKCTFRIPKLPTYQTSSACISIRIGSRNCRCSREVLGDVRLFIQTWTKSYR